MFFEDRLEALKKGIQSQAVKRVPVEPKFESRQMEELVFAYFRPTLESVNKIWANSLGKISFNMSRIDGPLLINGDNTFEPVYTLLVAQLCLFWQVGKDSWAQIALQLWQNGQVWIATSERSLFVANLDERDCLDKVEAAMLQELRLCHHAFSRVGAIR